MSSKKRTIISLPHKDLRRKSTHIDKVDDDVRDLCDRMAAATLEWEATREHEVGVALAAVQIDELKRVVIIRNDIENKEDKSFTVFINPEIIRHSGEPVTDYEGCLSVKDMYGLVPRYPSVTVRAMTIEGKQLTLAVNGFNARVLQHEIDHTNGILFIDHIKEQDAFYELNNEGHLEQLSHEDVLSSSILW